MGCVICPFVEHVVEEGEEEHVGGVGEQADPENGGVEGIFEEGSDEGAEDDANGGKDRVGEGFDDGGDLVGIGLDGLVDEVFKILDLSCVLVDTTFEKGFPVELNVFEDGR